MPGILSSLLSSNGAEVYTDSLPPTAGSSNQSAAESIHDPSSLNDNDTAMAEAVALDYAGHPNINDQAPLLRPPNPPKRGAVPAQTTANLRQPIRTSIEAKALKGRDNYPTNHEDLVKNADPFPGKKPTVATTTVGIRQFAGNSNSLVENDKHAASEVTLFKNPNGPKAPALEGVIPKESAKTGELIPDTADYQDRRPEQVLSHMSSVMMWAAKNDKEAGTMVPVKTKKKGDEGGEGDKGDNEVKTRYKPLDPVEVQFGYVQTPNGPKLYSSTNNPKSQEWLKKALADPMQHVKKAALEAEDPDVKRNANKLLFFHENQEARDQEAQKLQKSDPEKATRRLADLKVAGDIHTQMFTGTHTVVMSSGVPKNKDRHAEQNIAEAMHLDGVDGDAEIAGTKVRCYSCSASLGPNLKDADERFTIAGKAWVSQSSVDAQVDLLQGKPNDTGGRTAEADGRGRTHVNTALGSNRSSSASPARFPPSAEWPTPVAGPSSTKRPAVEQPEEDVRAGKRRAV